MVADVYISSIPDFKDDNGLWVKSIYLNNREQSITRSYILWKSVNYRTKEGGWWQRNNPRYEGSQNLFADYQSFTSWCNSQHGYMNKDPNGCFWQLDKDLLIEGNRNYGPDTCIFVPNNINKLFSASNSKRGKYPLGVTQRENGKFRAGVSDGYKNKIRLGQYDSPMEAHRAWQLGKIQVIENICNLDYIMDHEVLRLALLRKANSIQDDLENNRETL